MSLEAVIGLEIHVQLATRTKMFCADEALFGGEPNTRVCPVCLGLPGSLPVPNRRAVELAIRAGLGLGCTIEPLSIFARKNYFYPDLPKGYQITQHAHPLCTGGALEFRLGDGEVARVRLRRLHLEEDAGKSLHDRYPDASAIDLNRAGVPLVEIVTEPDLRSPGAARAFLLALKRTLEYLEVSDCDMEKGSLRVDANVSVRPHGSEALGARTEIKNLNSFASVEHALEFEIERQTKLLEGGEAPADETLGWDAEAGVAYAMRGKEQHQDYRYFPEPDLPPLTVAAAEVERIAASLPELPAARARRFQEAMGLPAYDADVLTGSRAIADYFEAATAAAGDPRLAGNWVMRDVLAWANRARRPAGEFPVPPAELGRLIALQREGRVTAAVARRVLERMLDTGGSLDDIVAAEAPAVAGEEEVRRSAAEVVAGAPAEVARYRAGETQLFGFLMGRLMRLTGGAADPAVAARVLRELLGE